MQENYVEGDLGFVFSQSVPLTLPIVAQFLHDKYDDADENDRAKALIQSCREQVDVLQDGCANEQAVHELRGMRLRVRVHGGDAVNAHLANMVVDAEGNIVASSAAHARHDASSFDGDATIRRERLKPFEVVALSTLLPKTAEEAMVLVPSLVRFEAADIQDAIGALEQ